MVTEVQGQVWIIPDPRKATARYLNICRTTQLLYQGAGTARKKQGQKSHLRSQDVERNKVTDSIPERSVLFSRLQPLDYDCFKTIGLF